MKRWLWILGVVAIAVGVGAVWWHRHQAGTRPSYRTAKVERGDVVQTVRATGVVAPIKLVQVGTQVNGPVAKLYVDFNDRVKAGDLVAQIEATVYQARLAQDQASLMQSLASVDAAQAKLVQAEKDLPRTQELTKRDMASQSDLDAAVANRDALAAQVKVAQAAVAQCKAALAMSQANLDYTTIRSPVDGVVVARNVSEGQTVVASMSAQTLFQIASDLRHVEVDASIPEADVGKIRTNQTVVFTVDAFEDEFTGRVAQVRLAAATVQNVVTYPVIILADNPDVKLFPGMTANISCEVARRTGVLRVPNGALRFKPDASAAISKKESGSKESSSPAGASGRPQGQGQRVWVTEAPGGLLAPLRVRLGITDGSFTEVKEPTKLAEGQAVIMGVAENGKGAQEGTVNPFTPRLPGAGARPAR